MWVSSKVLCFTNKQDWILLDFKPDEQPDLSSIVFNIIRIVTYLYSESNF